MTFTVIDIETTGLSAYYHKITEISAIRFNGKIKKEFNTLVNPEVEIPRFITKLTGIDNSMVKDAPTIDEVIPKFHKFLGSNVFVAHNATFDYNFLNFAINKHLETNLSNDKLCTCKLARRLLPDLPSKKLSSVYDHFEIINESAHRARGDALSTVKILENFLSILDEKGIKKTSDIVKFQSSKIPKP